MSYYIGIPAVLLAALLEVSVLPYFRIDGLQPNLVLVLLTAWLMVRGQSEAFMLIPFGGLFLGLVDAAPLGAALLALSPLALLQDFKAAHLGDGGLMLTVLFTAVMTVVYNLVYLLAFTVMGESGSWLTALTTVAIPTIVINVFFLLPIYWLLWVTSHQMRRAAYV